MIIEAAEALAHAIAEASPRGACGTVEILLEDEQWRALNLEMHRRTAQSRTFQPATSGDEWGMVHIYTPGGDVQIKRAE